MLPFIVWFAKERFGGLPEESTTFPGSIQCLDHWSLLQRRLPQPWRAVTVPGFNQRELMPQTPWDFPNKSQPRWCF